MQRSFSTCESRGGYPDYRRRLNRRLSAGSLVSYSSNLTSMASPRKVNTRMFLTLENQYLVCNIMIIRYMITLTMIIRYVIRLIMIIRCAVILGKLWWQAWQWREGPGITLQYQALLLGTHSCYAMVTLKIYYLSMMMMFLLLFQNILIITFCK